MLKAKDLGDELLKNQDKKKAKVLASFFKTKKGEYGEGDIFLGVIVPKQRIIANKFKELDLLEIQKLLFSKIHENRLTALMILVNRYKKEDNLGKKKIVDLYLKNTKNINNWDLVDLSSHYILGEYFFDKDKKILYQLSRSKNLWEKRIAVMSTYYFIKNNSFSDTLKIAEILLNEKHDLIHKAVGWMLREIGKRDKDKEKEFLDKYSSQMPRTMLRYAIEKFDLKEREYYLKK